MNNEGAQDIEIWNAFIVGLIRLFQVEVHKYWSSKYQLKSLRRGFPNFYLWINLSHSRLKAVVWCLLCETSGAY